MYVVAARWVPRPGEEEAVERALRTMAELTAREPGCRGFTVHRSRDDPRHYLLYERFDDESAFLAHRETEHFRTHVLGDAVPRLESREFTTYELLE